ncbi:YoaK family protein [Nocardia nova]|uniref:YoaK family protein n=1 Tax=Nocardia nova TaxID=37330 RepID=UPI0021576A85|nr:YoaK family protein [Nocardia nova]
MYACHEPHNSHRALLVGYGSPLATVAAFVNAVAILTLAIPVGNPTATTTRLGMDAANPWLFESSVLALILIGFLMGAACAGATPAPSKTHAGVRHSAVMIGDALLLVLAFAWSERTLSVFLAALACGLQNRTTSSLRTMQIRTTHFTGTVTDLGLIIGRSRLHGVDRWRAAVLSASERCTSRLTPATTHGDRVPSSIAACSTALERIRVGPLNQSCKPRRILRFLHIFVAVCTIGSGFSRPIRVTGLQLQQW